MTDKNFKAAILESDRISHLRVFWLVLRLRATKMGFPNFDDLMTFLVILCYPLVLLWQVTTCVFRSVQDTPKVMKMRHDHLAKKAEQCRECSKQLGAFEKHGGVCTECLAKSISLAPLPLTGCSLCGNDTTRSSGVCSGCAQQI